MTDVAALGHVACLNWIALKIPDRNLSPATGGLHMSAPDVAERVWIVRGKIRFLAH